MTLVVVSILILLAASAFTSGTETAMTSLERGRVHQLATHGNWRARVLERLISDRESLIGALLVGNNIFNILAASLATDVLIELTGHGGVIYATFIMTVMVVIFSEILPKTYALRYNEKFALLMAPAARVLVAILWPLALAAGWIVDKILRLLPGGSAADGGENATERLRGTLQFLANQGSLQKSDRDMLGGVLDLDHVDVSEIMTHRRKVFSVAVDTRPLDLAEQLKDLPYSRIPVFEGSADHVVGLVTVRDLFDRRDELGSMSDLRELMKKPWFVPETRPIRSQLQAFRAKRAHMAFVVDEYGDLQGLITLEDIIEEIVGDISDETDIPASELKTNADGSVTVLASVSVRDLNREMDWNIADEESSTLGGLVSHEAGRIPQSGETITLHGYAIEVLDYQGNWLEKLRIRRLASIIPPESDKPTVGDAK
jgi:Mg2+/Co2+ transporter CorB